MLPAPKLWMTFDGLFKYMNMPLSYFFCRICCRNGQFLDVGVIPPVGLSDGEGIVDRGVEPQR